MDCTVCKDPSCRPVAAYGGWCCSKALAQPPILPCWKCGCVPKPEPDYVGYSLTCSNYDADWQGEETGYVSSDPHVWGATREAVIEDWNEQALDNAEEEEASR